MAEEKKETWLNYLALTTVILAVCATLSTFKGGGFSTRSVMSQTQASDQWAFYQAKGIKSAVLESRMEILASSGNEPSAKDADKVNSYKEEQKEIEKKAREFGELSEQHLSVHNTLAKGVTLFQISIAICAISALTRRKWLWYGSMVLGLAGLVFLGMGML